MKNLRIKNNGSNTVRVTGHRELQPNEERELPEAEARFLASTPRDSEGKGVDVVEPARQEPHSKSEARRLDVQRGKK